MLMLRAAALQLPGITHGFFGRTGGVSEGIYASLNCGPGSSDERAAVLENRARVARTLADNTTLITLYQIHSAKVVSVTVPWHVTDAPQADAMVTNMPGVAIGILAADCAPVLLADSKAHVIGAAHAGWKGAHNGVTDAVIEQMERQGARRENIVAAVGPCISQANYEVGAEFHAVFVDRQPADAPYFLAGERPGHFQFDLEAYVAARLAAAGVRRVERLSACTYARENDFFSYRRATHRGEPDYGRQVSAILLCK